LAAQEAETTDTKKMAADLMAAFNLKLESGTREALTHSITAAVLSQLPTREAREGFILVLGIESRFGQVTGKSPAGAVGMAQVMPKLAAELGERCGLGRVKPEDIARESVSLYLGACHFRLLYEQFNGNVALAQAAYNSGAGRTLAYVKGRALPEETAHYVSKAAIMRGNRSVLVELGGGQ
jgi:hypothetical protein